MPCADEIAELLHHIINLSLSSSTVPLIWKEIRIIPLFKSGDEHNSSNYRLILVLPVLSKILERSVHTQLTEYLEGNNLLSTNQFEYRKNRSTELAATYFIDNIKKHANSGKMVGAVFMDFIRAFDTINHGTLNLKLQSYGINDKEILWFCDNLFHRFQTVYYNGKKSSKFPLLTEVLQGSI